MIDPVEGGGLVVSGALAGKLLDLAIARFVRRADATEAEREKERDEREKAMSGKLDQLLREVGELRGDARQDRERQTALAAAMAEVKDRIDGVSANHGPRLGLLEQELAALKARVGDPLRRSRGRR